VSERLHHESTEGCSEACAHLRPIGTKFMYVWWILREPYNPNPEYAKLSRLVVTALTSE